MLSFFSKLFSVLINNHFFQNCQLVGRKGVREAGNDRWQVATCWEKERNKGNQLVSNYRRFRRQFQSKMRKAKEK